MKKVILILLCIALITVALVSFVTNRDLFESEDLSTTTVAATTSTTYTTTRATTPKTTKHISRYCEVDDCYKEGTKKYINGLSGEPEYYCYTHYNELMDMIGDLEEDVGNGYYSKHTCEECNREGTYPLSVLVVIQNTIVQNITMN